MIITESHGCRVTGYDRNGLRLLSDELKFIESVSNEIKHISWAKIGPKSKQSEN